MTHKAISQALADFGDDVLWHLTRFAQGSMDLVTLAIVGGLIYLATLDAASAGLQGRAMFGVQATADGIAGVALASSHAPTSCGLTNDLLATDHRSCLHALVLEPAAI